MALPYKKLVLADEVAIYESYQDSPCRVTPFREFIAFDNRSHQYGEKAINSCWKCHISIHPDDLATAWDEVIWPILEKHAVSFKMTKQADIQSKLKRVTALSDEIQRIENLIKNDFQDYAVDPKPSSAKYKTVLSAIDQGFEKKRLCPRLFPDSLIQQLPSRPKPIKHKTLKFLAQGHKRKTYETSLQQYYSEKAKIVIPFLEALSHEIKQGIASIKRMDEGMQITIYLPDSQETTFDTVANQLESALRMHGIRPGKIHDSDRPLGDYCSVRHPGFTYHPAVEVDSYNVNNVPDNFNRLIGSPLVQICQHLETVGQGLLKLSAELPLSILDNFCQDLIVLEQKYQDIIDSYKTNEATPIFHQETTARLIQKTGVFFKALDQLKQRSKRIYNEPMTETFNQTNTIQVKHLFGG